jgi:hypothetical protein
MPGVAIAMSKTSFELPQFSHVKSIWEFLMAFLANHLGIPLVEFAVHGGESPESLK